MLPQVTRYHSTECYTRFFLVLASFIKYVQPIDYGAIKLKQSKSNKKTNAVKHNAQANKQQNNTYQLHQTPTPLSYLVGMLFCPFIPLGT